MVQSTQHPVVLEQLGGANNCGIMAPTHHKNGNTTQQRGGFGDLLPPLARSSDSNQENLEMVMVTIKNKIYLEAPPVAHIPCLVWYGVGSLCTNAYEVIIVPCACVVACTPLLFFV